MVAFLDPWRRAAVLEGEGHCPRRGGTSRVRKGKGAARLFAVAYPKSVVT
jgi:hypothetical protein